MLAAFYGLMCSVLPMRFLVIPAIPILLGIAMILWALPDIGGLQERWMRSAMLWYLTLNILWPAYIALNVPGLPWITPTRIATFALMSVALVNYACSAELRQRIAEAMATVPVIHKAFWAFWGTTVLSTVIGIDPIFALNKFINNQIYWTAMFGLAAWLATREGFAGRVGHIIGWTIVPVALIAINEYRLSAVVWVPYIPQWLQVDPVLIDQVGSVNARAFTNEYRVRGTFAGALYFAEYMAIALPFAIHAMVRAKDIVRQALLAIGVLAVMSAMFFTQSRSAMLAILLTPLVYGFMAAWRTREQRPTSLVATATVMAYPAMAGALAVLVLFWKKLHDRVIGGGQHQASSYARQLQWEMGWPKIFEAPFGHGAGSSGRVLQYYNPGRESPTVDSYFLTLLLDHGFLGLITFLVLMFAAVWFGFRAYTRARDEEMLVLAPLTAALLNFTIIKSVSSTEGSMPIVFIMIGCVLGLTAQQQRRGMVPGKEGTPRRATAFVNDPQPV